VMTLDKAGAKSRLTLGQLDTTSNRQSCFISHLEEAFRAMPRSASISILRDESGANLIAPATVINYGLTEGLDVRLSALSSKIRPRSLNQPIAPRDQAQCFWLSRCTRQLVPTVWCSSFIPARAACLPLPTSWALQFGPILMSSARLRSLARAWSACWGG